MKGASEMLQQMFKYLSENHNAQCSVSFYKEGMLYNIDPYLYGFGEAAQVGVRALMVVQQ
jgi:hypothetical protein